MKKLLICLFLCCLASVAKAEYYIAYATTNVNLRECPSTDCAILAKVPKNEILFVDTDDKVGEFYHVVFVDLDISGYVHSKYVYLYEKVKEENGHILSVSGEIGNYNPTVEITNDANVSMTLKINEDIYNFKAYEVKNLTLFPGNVKIRASSPGIIPFVGKDEVLSNYEYTWRFYVTTVRR